MSYESLRALGQGGGQPNLNLSIVKEFPVLLPNDSQQREFVKISEFIKRLKEQAIVANNESNDLFNSLSQKAFSGEI